jgi:guanylate kinase
MSEHGRISFSISYTTRPPRDTEKDGVDYHFVDEQTFSTMVTEDRFAEWALVHGHKYGTSKATIEESLARGKDLLFDIDWQGATQLKSKYPNDTVMIFVLPPSMEELSERLYRRGTDTPEVVARRLAKAKEELGHYGEYQYLLLNDSLKKAYDNLKAIYHAEHLAQRRQAFRALRLLEEARESDY